MQPTRNFHHRVTDTVLPVTNFILDDTTTLHTTDCVLNPHFLARNATILFFLFRPEFTATRFLGGLSHGYCCDGKSLKPHVLVEGTISRQTIGFIISNRFVMPFPSMRWAQVLNDARLSNQEDIFYRMAFLLATVIFLLFVGIYRSLDRTFGAVVVKKGAPLDDDGSASGRSIAVRAGSAWTRCKAPGKMGRSSCNHLFATDCRIPNKRPCASWVRFCFICTRINNSLSAIVGNGEFLYETYRRFSRGRPSMVVVCIASPKHASNAGTKARNSVGVSEVKASRLVSLSATS